MPLFRRAKKAAVPADTGLPVPPWCPLGPAEWQEFLALLNNLFLDGEGSDQPMRFGAEQHLQLGIGSGIPLDLAELALLVRPLPRAQWREAAVGHLNGLLELGDRRRALHQAGYEEVGPLLLPRVVPLRTVAEDFALARPLTEDLAVVLVVRVDGDRSSPVPASQFRTWNVDGDEVWALAERNLAAEPVVRDDSGSANPMVSVTCETGFTCTHLLRAADLLGRPAPWASSRWCRTRDSCTSRPWTDPTCTPSSSATPPSPSTTGRRLRPNSGSPRRCCGSTKAASRPWVWSPPRPAVDAPG